jgi:hypothetical protein
LDEALDIHPAELVTVKLYVPAGRPEILALVPVPVVVIPPGVRVSVHVPAEGKPLNITLPVATEHDGLVIAPTTGVEGLSFTDNVQVAFAAAQCEPKGLSVVTVIITCFPKSPFFGVYVNVKGDFDAEAGLTEPAPFSFIVTFVALPPKLLPAMVTGVVPHILPLVMLSVTVGLFAH